MHRPPSAFHAQRLFDPSDADQDGILHSTIGVIPCGACVARSVMFRPSNLSSVYPRTAEVSVSNVGDSVTAVRCDEHSIPSLLPAAFELNFTKALTVSVRWELPPCGPGSCSTRATLAGT